AVMVGVAATAPDRVLTGRGRAGRPPPRGAGAGAAASGPPPRESAWGQPRRTPGGGLLLLGPPRSVPLLCATFKLKIMKQFVCEFDSGPKMSDPRDTIELTIELRRLTLPDDPFPREAPRPCA